MTYYIKFFFLGDSYICAGSDEGIIFIWDKAKMEIVRALYGDTSIVNCIQPHPSACVMVSSGIDTAVKVWSPTPEVSKNVVICAASFCTNSTDFLGGNCK